MISAKNADTLCKFWSRWGMLLNANDLTHIYGHTCHVNGFEIFFEKNEYDKKIICFCY